MPPDAHCVMAKNDSLLTYMNFGQRTPGSKHALGFARHLVMVSLDKMDHLAVQSLAIGCDLFDAAHAEISEEIQRVVWLDTLVHPIHDARVHLFRGRERSIAVVNDVEVPEMEVGREPSISHIVIMEWMVLQRPLWPATISQRRPESLAFTHGTC